MTRRAHEDRRRLGVIAALVMLPLVAVLLAQVPVQAQRDEQPYIGSVDVVRGEGDGGDVVRGVVFEDRNRDSARQQGEPGVKDVAVTNGRDVALTDARGRYELPAHDNMTVSVTKPAGFEVPLDELNFPQFYYHHLPEGSPDLRFGGLEPTGPLPTAINFPIVRSAAEGRAFDCAVVGDTQTYSNRELGYLRDGVVEDIAARGDMGECGALLLGDLMGDDLALYPRFKQVMSLADVPIRAVPGNHDLDFDAPSADHSKDTYRREIGPAWYSFDIGDVHFVGLDNVSYPCTAEDSPGRSYCERPQSHPRYNGVIGEAQMTWLANDLASVPADKLVVVMTHIPLVSYIDQRSEVHQTDDVAQLYALLEGRKALSLSGHTHTVEAMSTGTSFGGWEAAVGVEALPFPHVVAGAASGSWWGGDLDADGVPMAFARNGTPGGYGVFSFDRTSFTTAYDPTTLDDGQTMGVSLNHPRFREWAQALRDFNRSRPRNEETPPVNANDLGDPDLVTTAELGDTWLVANVYNGTRETEVTAFLDGEPLAMEHTQPGTGEGIREGLEWADPFAMVRQLQVARHAFRSTSGDERAQGYERFRGSRFGPADPRPEDEGTDQSPHVWRLRLPTDLPAGAHDVTVRTADPIGGAHTQVYTFEVVDELPPQYFRTETFQ